MKKFLCILTCAVILVSSLSFNSYASSPSPQEGSVEAIALPEYMPFIMYVFSALGIRFGFEGMPFSDVKLWLSERYSDFILNSENAWSLQQIGEGFNSSISNFGILGGLSISKGFLTNIFNFARYLQTEGFVSTSPDVSIPAYSVSPGLRGNIFSSGGYLNLNQFYSIDEFSNKIVNIGFNSNGSFRIICQIMGQTGSYSAGTDSIGSQFVWNEYQTKWTNFSYTRKANEVPYFMLTGTEDEEYIYLNLFFSRNNPVFTSPYFSWSIPKSLNSYNLFNEITNSTGSEITTSTQLEFVEIIDDLQEKLDNAEDTTLFWIQQYMQQDGQIRNLRQKLLDSEDDLLVAQSMLNELGWQVENGYITSIPQYDTQYIYVPIDTPYSVKISEITDLELDNQNRENNKQLILSGLLDVDFEFMNPFDFTDDNSNSTYVDTLKMITAASNGTPIYTLLIVSVITAFIGYLLYGKD